MSLNRVFLALALASVAFTSPLDQGLAIAQRTRQIDSQMIKAFNCHGAQSSNCTMADLAGSTGDMGIIETRIRAALECRGQSCLVADTSGSTGRLPNMKAEGTSELQSSMVQDLHRIKGRALQISHASLPTIPH